MSADQRTAFRTCPLCEATCGLEITLENDRVVKVRGDAEDVFSRGYICPKGAALGELHHDPDRLRTPLVRRGDSFEPTGWDEALAEVEKGLAPLIKEFGGDAVGVYLGNPCVHHLAGIMYVRPLLKALKTKNIFSSSTVDQMPKQVSAGLMFGGPASIPVPDLDRTDYLVIMGANPMVSNGSLCTAPDFPGRLRAIRSRGGKLVVIDPCRTRTAREADRHLPIRPGTDPLLLLALARVLFEEGLVNLGPLGDLVVGLEKIEALAEDFAPEAVAEVSGIAAEDIRTLARELAAAPSAAVYGRMGLSTVEFGAMANWLVDVVNVLIGALDRPGGVMFPLGAHSPRRLKPGGKGWKPGRWSSRVKGLPEVCGELSIAALAEEIETPGPGRIRSLITMAANPVLTAPEGARLDRLLSGLDFMVSLDIYLNETTRRANVILPPPSPLEHSHYDLAFYNLAVRNIARYSPPVLALGNRPDAWEILLRLALIASGQGASADAAGLDDFIAAMSAQGAAAKTGLSAEEILAQVNDRRGPERLLDLMIRTGAYGDGFGAVREGLTLAKLEENPHGLDLGALQPQLPGILRTPSGRIELAPDILVEDAARLKKVLNNPAPTELLLVGRRHLRSNNSWMHNLKSLVSGPETCTVRVHPEDAARRGLNPGDRARLKTSTGSIELPVEITDEVRPGVISAPHGWGHDLSGVRLKVAADRPGVNTNLLADLQDYDPVSVTLKLNGIPVELAKA